MAKDIDYFKWKQMGVIFSGKGSSQGMFEMDVGITSELIQEAFISTKSWALSLNKRLYYTFMPIVSNLKWVFSISLLCSSREKAYNKSSKTSQQ